MESVAPEDCDVNGWLERWSAAVRWSGFDGGDSAAVGTAKTLKAAHEIGQFIRTCVLHQVVQCGLLL